MEETKSQNGAEETKTNVGGSYTISCSGCGVALLTWADPEVAIESFAGRYPRLKGKASRVACIPHFQQYCARKGGFSSTRSDCKCSRLALPGTGALSIPDPKNGLETTAEEKARIQVYLKEVQKAQQTQGQVQEES